MYLFIYYVRKHNMLQVIDSHEIWYLQYEE